MSQCQPTRRQALTLGVQQLHPQRLHGAGTAIVGGAAANRQDHPLRSGIQCRADQLASAVGAADAGISLSRRDQLQATGFGHFDDRGVVVRQPAPGSVDRVAQWPANLRAAQLAFAGGQDRFDRAFTTVRHRAFEQLRIGPHLREANGDGFGDTLGAEAVLERVGGDDDFHGVAPVSMPLC
ncbi:hypothetical protein D3C73_1161440 [compost metagenome]